MTRFHAVMIDETGCELGATIEAENRSDAYEQLREVYPESRCDQLEDREQEQERERAMYEHISRGGDWDEDGRPIYGPEYEEDYEDEDEDEDED